MALFAALIVPWFVNWNDYKTTFEVEAGKILGHPVHVIGTAKATILPSPSLTFTDVEVGDVDGQPMMTVDRFSVTIELMPLLQGEIRVVSMKLDRPSVHVSVDDKGADWLERSEASQALDPEKVALEAVEVNDGSITYSDARTGVALDFAGINATVETRTLLGPWRIEGSYLDGGERVPFRFATGLRLDDGTIRVKSDFSPVRWPVAVSLDGVVSNKAGTGLAYRGTYNVAQIETAAPDTPGAEFAGWRSDGSFTLTGQRLVIDKAVVSNGPPDRPSSLAGALTVNFGDHPSFEASAEARQLDLDRSLGGGPTEPVEVALAAGHLVDWLTSLPIPSIPGRLTFNVPAIVVGGAIIQDVDFAAEPAAAGWKIDNFRARLPGQSTLTADGILTTNQQFGFVGAARLAVAQPATFAAWWRGRSQQDAGRLLSAFDLSGQVDIAPGKVAVDQVEAQIGDATITGRFAWSESARDHHRHLGTDLKADRIDFVQVKALAELLVGQNLADTAALADSYSILLAAGEFAFEDFSMRDVAIDAAYADDVLTVVQLGIGDLGGASFRVTSGRVDDLTTNPRGHLDAKLEASTLDGVVHIVNRFWPNTRLARWLTTAAPALAPAALNARITAPAEEGGSGFRVALDGAAGSTSFNIVAGSNGKPADWRNDDASLSVTLDSPDTVGLARQAGLAAVSVDGDTGAHVEVHGSGVPDAGMGTTIGADVDGLAVKASGELKLAADFTPMFTGSFGATADDLDPLVAMAGLGIPGAAIGTNVDLAGTFDLGEDGTKLAWNSGTIGGHLVGATVTLARGSDRAWRIDGGVDVDEADLGWLMALGLGFAPLPTDDPAVPWSKTPFISPVYGPVSGKLAVTADHLTIGDGLDVANTRFDVTLQPQQVDLNLTGGQLAGGTVTGGLSIHNVAGNANLIARFDLKGAALESFVWKLDGRSVATGVLDLSANFEATGRSPAGLVSSATGGGVISVRDGEARYVNPGAVRPLVRASDLGQQYSEDALRLSFTEAIDGDVLKFEQADSAFAIAAGAARVKNLTIRGQGAEASGNAVIDFNTMVLDSDWTLTFDPGDTKVVGTDPRVGLVFSGSLAAPTRTIDVLPLASYLNMRQEARMLDIIAMEEATRAEKDRLTRLVRKLGEDDARRAREAQAAAEAEARRRAVAVAAATAVETLHQTREVVTEQRWVVALKLFADKAAAAGNVAEKAAADAAGIAASARQNVEQTRDALARALAAEREATTGAKAAADAVTQAQSALDAAKGEATTALAAADAADKVAVQTTAAEVEARKHADAAAAEKAMADALLKAAVTKAGSAGAAVDQASAKVEAADAVLQQARSVAAEADAALARAQRVLTDAQAALDAASADADEKNAAEATATDAANAAVQKKQEADKAAAAAADALAAAVQARETARARADAATAEAVKTKTAAADAAKTASTAATVAQALAVDANAGADAIAVAENAKTTAKITADRAATRQAEADEASKAAAVARAQYDLAEAKRVEAAKAADAAARAAQDAADALAAARAATDKAAAENKAAVATLASATAARDGATSDIGVRRAADVKANAAVADATDALQAAEGCGCGGQGGDGWRTRRKGGGRSRCRRGGGQGRGR